MSDNCTCDDMKQTKKICCANCRSSCEREMSHMERVGACRFHKISYCRDVIESIICPVCKLKGFYLEQVQNSFPSYYVVKRKSRLFSCFC